MRWKCALIPKGEICPYEQYAPLSCCALVIRAALQQLRWSLPFIGKRFKTYESLVRCNEWRKEI